MSSLHDDSHTFIVRIWREPREIDDAAPKWRGVVEDVATGDRNYLHDLNDILNFIEPYLTGPGVNSGIQWRIRQLLQRRKQYR